MSFAFLSTKRSSAEATGKFGVGLQTLKALGSRLEVHCPPYHFAVEGSQVRRIQSRRSIAGVYAPSKFDTLLVLQLNPGVDLGELRGWVSRWGADSMLFLANVRRIAAIDPAKPRRARAVLELRPLRRDRKRLRVRGSEIECQVAQLREPATKQRFTRFIGEVPVPRSVERRSNKKTGTFTPMGFALGGERGRFFAGLPLRLAPSLPWSVHGQLDPELSRNSLKHSEWNDWVLKRLADLISTVIVDLFEENPKAAWAAVPLDEELGEQPDPWLQSRVQDLFNTVQSNVARRARIVHDGRDLSFAEVAYEDSQLAGLLTGEEAARLSGGGTLLPVGLRDSDGRWREVLDELGVSRRLGADEVRPMLSWSNSDLAHRNPRWFSRLTAVLVAADPDATWNDQCLVLGDNRRVSPSGIHDEGLLLVRDASSAGLAQRLGLVVGLHSDYLGRTGASRTVQEWLSETKLLVSAPSDRDALGALARFPEDTPKRLEDHELRTLREAVEDLPDSEHRVGLLRELGRRVAAEGACYEDGKTVKGWFHISSLYLPAAFQGRAPTWARAASRVSGLNWIDGHYAKALLLPDERGPAGARDFLMSLGAEVAPRLEPLQTMTFNRQTVQDYRSWSAPEYQKRVATERGYIRFVRGDTESVALHAVIRDIARAEQPNRRRRGTALLATLHGSWERLYADHATIRAFEADRTLFGGGRIPGTWVADAASVPWMDNELGESCLPCDLVVRTPAYLAAIGDEPAVFAAGLDQRQADWPVLEALGVDARPRAKHLVEQLIELQRRDLTESSESNVEHAGFIYLALSSMCPPRGTPAPELMVDDLSVRGLGRRFAATQQRPGLIRTSTGWHAPAEVFAGRELFGRRRPFVTASSAAAPLWRALRVDTPSVGDCIAVLKEIADDSTGAKERAVLADTYRYISGQLRGGVRRPAALRNLPLWTGSKWVTKRPIYAFDDRELAQVLSTRLRSAIWQAPGALGPLESFMQGARITKVNENAIKLTAATQRRGFAHAYLQERFELATLHLRAGLAEEDEVAHDALVMDWDEFHKAAVRLAQPLEVELRLGRSKATRALRRAQLDIPSLTLYVTEQLDLADENAAGYALATVFPTVDQRNIALRWTAAWRRAERGEEPDVMRLAPRQQEDIRHLLEQMEASARTPKTPLKPRTKPSRGVEEAAPETPKLKSPDDLAHGVEVSVVEPDPFGESISRRGLRKSKPPGGTKREFEPRTPKQTTGDWDPEDIAIEAVRQALWQIDESEMQDVSRFRGLGADGLRNDEFIEVKHNRRGLPTSISLDANEFERARGEHRKFVLAVAYDLDTDLQTKVRFYVDPLAVLQKLPQTSVALGGFKSTPALEVTFNTDTPD